MGSSAGRHVRAIKRDAGESLGAESADGVVRRVGRAGARRDRRRAREQAPTRQLDNNGAVASDVRVPVWLGGG